MKFQHLGFVFLSLLLVACGDAPKKTGDGTNNTVNNSINNSGGNNVVVGNNSVSCQEGEVRANVNGTEGCYSSCGADGCASGTVCTSGICIPSSSNNANNVTNNDCRSRVDCRADQECKDGTCRDLLQCDGRDSDSCLVGWGQCLDGKDYVLDCSETEGVCDCRINGETVLQFEDLDVQAEVCDFGGDSHRMANENCDWLVPAL